MRYRLFASLVLLLLLAACNAPVSQPTPRALTRLSYLPIVSIYKRSLILGTECDYPYLENPQCPVSYIEQANTGWIRLASMDWRTLEPLPGAPATFQDEISQLYIEGAKRAYAAGIKTIMVIRTTPDWASSNPGHPCAPPLALYYPDFSAFVLRVVNAFSPWVGHYEIWNEPEFPEQDPYGYVGCWTSGTDYANMLKVVYQTVKPLHPEVQIIAPAVGYVTQFTYDAIKAGVEHYCDIFSYHAYQGQNWPNDNPYSPSTLVISSKITFMRSMPRSRLTSSPSASNIFEHLDWQFQKDSKNYTDTSFPT